MAKVRDSIPDGLPYQLFNGYVESTSQMVGDSGIALKIDDTTAKPRAGYTVIKYLSNRKPYYWNGSAYVPFGGNIPYYTSLATFTAATPSLNDVCVLDDSVYGGGIFTAHNAAAESLAIDSGFVFPTNINNVVWVRKVYDPNLVKMDWYNVKAGFSNNIMPYFQKAEAYLLNKKGIIQFGSGSFNAIPFFSINQSNITVIGEGQNKTVINASPTGAGGLVINTNSRDIGWKLLPAQMLTYNDAGMKAGRGYIDLKVVGSSDSLKRDAIIFINGGANYFDQNYGEFNVVDSIIGTRVFLRYNMNRDYTSALSSWGATLTAAFTPPTAGSTGTINFTLAGGGMPAGLTISIGNDLYSVVSSTSTSAVVTNVPNKGNGSATFAIGTHIYKYRTIVVTPSTVYNTIIQGMTINGYRKVLTVGNTLKTTFRDIRFNWHPDNPYTGGLTIDADDGRDFKMQDCEVHADMLQTMQFARAFSDIKFLYTKFFNAAWQFSEFNSNVEATGCDVHLRATGLLNENSPQGVLMGGSCNDINIHDNHFYFSGLTYGFYTAEIQGFTNGGQRDFYVTKNTISYDSVNYGFAGNSFANIQVSGNTQIGNVNLLYNMRADTFLTTDNRLNAQGKFGFGSKALFDNNSFDGYIDGFGIPASNVWYTNNYINRFGAANAATEYNTWGNVLYTHSAIDSISESFRLCSNTFKNWNLVSNSLSLYGFPLGNTAFICDNHFVNSVTYSSVKDSVISLQCPGEQTIPYTQIYFGRGTPLALSSPNLTYDYGTLKVQSSNFSVTSTNPGARVWIPAATNYGFSSSIDLLQASNTIDIRNGNTDAVGFAVQRGITGTGNYSESRFTSGRTLDNNFIPRQGYYTWYIGDATGTSQKKMQLDSLGKITLTSTIAGTTGNQTATTATGKVLIASGATSVTVTNPSATTGSNFHLQVEGTNASITAVVAPANGSFVITLSSAPSVNTYVEWTILN